MNQNNNPFSSDEAFCRRVGEIMLQWEQRRGNEIEHRVFLLSPETEARLERIEQCIRSAKMKPVDFRWDFDPVYNQINITVEDYIFSNGSLDLPAILKEEDSYCIDALDDGCLVLEMGIHHAAFELEE